MNYLFFLLVLVALVVCALSQYVYYPGYTGAAYPYAYNHGAYYPYNYYWK